RPAMVDPSQQPGRLDRSQAIHPAVVAFPARLLRQAQNRGDAGEYRIASAARLRYRWHLAIELRHDREQRTQEVAEAADDLSTRIVGHDDLKDCQQYGGTDQRAEKAPQGVMDIDRRSIGNHDAP